MNDTALATAYAANALALKAGFNEGFWSPTEGMYRDNLTSNLYPQDANSLAVLFNLTTSAEQASSVSAGLTRYWNEVGAVSPELPDNVAPFIGAMEVSSCLSTTVCSRLIMMMIVASPLCIGQWRSCYGFATSSVGVHAVYTYQCAIDAA